VGAWPKRLFPFRLADGAEPFAKLQLYIDFSNERHLVEILGTGQQYVIGGIHPKTGEEYVWRRPLPASAVDLPTITREQAAGLLQAIQEEVCELLGLGYECVGNGSVVTRRDVNQDTLIATDLDVLEAAVKTIPNSSETFPGREDYIRFGFALRGATQDDPGRGLDLFSEWAMRWEGNHNGTNTPDQVQRDWDTFDGPYELGADYVFDVARKHGFQLAVHQFSAGPAPPDANADIDPAPIENSELWAAREFVDTYIDRLKWVPQWGSWVIWDGARWKRDDMGQAFGWAQRLTLRLADIRAQQGATAQERKMAIRQASAMSSEHYIRKMMALALGDSRVVTAADRFDANSWILGTPTSYVDLKTGHSMSPDPALLVSRLTAVGPDAVDCPRWKAFLQEATGGDKEYVDCIQRYLGYCLTGDTREQLLHFAYGPGGNGKSVFLETIAGLLGEYAAAASMDSFTEYKGERHPTDLAGLQGSRLVTASETQNGRRWDEARVKSMTVGERLRVRYMRQDFFEYVPQFKLLFAGNHKPELSNLDDAMRRRFVLLPFDCRPDVVDPRLKEKLIAEWPGILAWAIEGCLEWNRSGLGNPVRVRTATQEYFEDEDTIGRWAAQRVAIGVDGYVRSTTLFQDWCAWCGQNNEVPGTQKRFSQELKSRRWISKRDAEGTRFDSIALLQSRPDEFPVESASMRMADV
jgi:putative DNA primase/helicase